MNPKDWYELLKLILKDGERLIDDLLTPTSPLRVRIDRLGNALKPAPFKPSKKAPATSLAFNAYISLLCWLGALIFLVQGSVVVLAAPHMMSGFITPVALTLSASICGIMLGTCSKWGYRRAIESRRYWLRTTPITRLRTSAVFSSAVALTILPLLMT